MQLSEQCYWASLQVLGHTVLDALMTEGHTMAETFFLVFKLIKYDLAVILKSF